ncbi:MAG TPA: dihydroorotate dehydrogenase [Chloroflexi bacterium]|nr:dihydroorotate dehydrogenase [Chloroflexota bacterium]
MSAVPAPLPPEAPGPDLRVDLGRGLVLPNPVGLASGTAGYGFELRQLIDLDRLGALFTKGTTLRPRDGNPPPRVAEVRGGMLNSIGLHNPGVEHVAAVYAAEFTRWRVPVVVNVAGGNVDDYLGCLDRLDAAEGIAGYELNISCPNIANGLDYGRDPVAAARLVAATRARTGRHLMVKLSPNVTDIAAVARAVEDAGADSVSAVNTYVGMKIHRGIRAPVLPGRGTGGLSGPVIKPLALAAVAQVRAAVSIPVVGVGGIMDAGDAQEFLIAGANAVQVGTATFVNPAAALEVLDGLLALALRSGIGRPPGRPGGAVRAVPPAGIEPASTG